MASEMTSETAPATRTIQIDVDEDMLPVLKKSGYVLCIATRVEEGTYNVIWHASSGFMNTNHFSWTHDYDLFATNVPFAPKSVVRPSTTPVSIRPGEQAVLAESGVLGSAVAGGPATGITLVNRSGTISPGLQQTATGLDGTTSTSVTWVAPNPIVRGTATLTPVDKVLIWFEQGATTGAMFSTPQILALVTTDAVSESIELDLTSVASAGCRYSDEKWTAIGG